MSTLDAFVEKFCSKANPPLTDREKEVAALAMGYALAGAGEPEQDAGWVEAWCDHQFCNGHCDVSAASEPAPDAQREAPAVEVGEDVIAWISPASLRHLRQSGKHEYASVYKSDEAAGLNGLDDEPPIPLYARAEQREAVPEPFAKPADVEAAAEQIARQVAASGKTGRIHQIAYEPALAAARIALRIQPAPAQAETAVPEGDAR